MTGFKSSGKIVHGICMLYPSGTKKVTLCCTNSSRGLQPHLLPFPFQFPDQTFGLCIPLTKMKAARLLVIGGLMLLSVICWPGEASTQQDQQLQFSFFTSFGGGFISSGSVPAVGLALQQVANQAVLPGYTLNYVLRDSGVF